MTRRGRRARVVLAAMYVASLALPLLVGNRPLAIRYDGRYYWPLTGVYPGFRFGGTGAGEPDYRALRARLAREGGGNWVVMPPYPFGPTETLLAEPGAPPAPPTSRHWLGTDNVGRDVLARLAYGFQVSISFALLSTALACAVGIVAGGLSGYAGGGFDLLGQRVMEIWAALPVLYVVILVGSIAAPSRVPGRPELLQPGVLALVVLLAAFEWVVVAQYVRAEFYREKARDYVAAARASGAPAWRIMFRHILPNAVSPIAAIAPLMVIGNITSLAALDFLGFGLPPPAPSWGEVLGEGLVNPAMWWLVLFPVLALTGTVALIAAGSERR